MRTGWLARLWFSCNHSCFIIKLAKTCFPHNIDINKVYNKQYPVTMSKSSDNESSNGDNIYKNKDGKKMYLNPNLVYKECDSNGKESLACTSN